MSNISKITFAEECIYKFDVTPTSTGASFFLSLGYPDDTGLPLDIVNTGFSFSGVSGYLFDQEGSFVGGYRKDVTTNLEVHKKDSSSYSYYIDDVLIANNRSFSETGLYAIKLEKIGDVSLDFTLFYD